MDIIGGIGAATEGLKLVNELRKIDRDLDKAELKLRLIDVADRLMDSKQALQEAQNREAQLQTQIRELEEKLKLKIRLRDRNGMLFEMGGGDVEIGVPYCNQCFVKDDKLFRLLHHEAKVGSYAHYRCDNCKVTIVTGPSIPSQPSPRRRGSWMDR